MNAPLPLNIAAAATASVSARAERQLRQAEVVAALAPLLPKHALLWHAEDTAPYECDGLTAYREQPLLVALPETEVQVAAVLRECHRLNVPVVARGAGTGLSGGALPHALGVTLSLAKFNKILRVDATSRTATVKPRTRSTLCNVRPYFRQCTPPEFSATLPPMVQAIWLLGSGA